MKKLLSQRLKPRESDMLREKMNSSGGFYEVGTCSLCKYQKYDDPSPSARAPMWCGIHGFTVRSWERCDDFVEDLS